ncbi:hypothetical protein EPN42_02610 [bacterium]|nr:MAG: hypothetical protein EPN42_02610 [bacterium]
MGTYVLALIGCALAFGGLMQHAEIQMAGWDPGSLGSIPAALHAVSIAGTLVVPVLWVSRALRPVGAFLFGFAAAALIAGPIFASLALEGYLPHL